MVADRAPDLAAGLLHAAFSEGLGGFAIGDP